MPREHKDWPPQTCAYCMNHCWHDALETHVCYKDGEERGLDETCALWRRMKYLFG